jgi:hypothetical protein
VCSVGNLRIAVTTPLGSAGSLHYQLTFENGSSSPCTLYGFPGVSFLDSEGHEIGPPSKRGTAVVPKVVELTPGEQGYARLDVTDPGIPPCAGPGAVMRIQVFPPGSYVAEDVVPPFHMSVCTSPDTPNYIDTTISPVTAASSNGYNS